MVLVVKNPPANVGGEGNGNPLQYSCLENSVDRRAWWAAVRGVAQSRTWLKRLSMHTCIGEGNGNPLQYSCLENPRDRRAWWADVYGVAQSWTRLKWLSSSSSQCRRLRRCGFDPWVRKIPWGRAWQPTPVFLPGKSQGQSLTGYSPWGCKVTEMT